jgi:mRNA interferase MazF
MEVVSAPAVRRGQVFLVGSGPTQGSEIRAARPCVVVSPDDLNLRSRSFIVAPLTKGRHPYPFRIPCRFRGQAGFVVLDQIRTVDRRRLLRSLGTLSSPTLARALSALRDMFAP